MRAIYLLIFLANVYAFADETSLSQRLDALEARSTDFGFHRVDVNQSFTLLGPVASKIYFHPEATWEFGLASDFLSYTQVHNVDRSNVANLLPTAGFNFNKRLLFNAQLLFENGGAESSDTVTVRKGQAIVQFAYLEWFLSPERDIGLRVGHQLLPVGLQNTRNEPTTFYGVRRPSLEREVIPTSWHENGILFWVSRPLATLEVGAFNSLDSSGFRSDTFLAGGRSQGQNAPAKDWLGLARVHAKLEQVALGASVVAGPAAQASSTAPEAAFSLLEAHARFFLPRFEVSAMTALGQIQNAFEISVQNSAPVASRARGSSAQAAYEVIGGERKLWLFSRYTAYNLNDLMPSMFAADPTLNKKVWTTGVSYYPDKNLLLKGDFANQSDSAGHNYWGLDLGIVLAL